MFKTRRDATSKVITSQRQILKILQLAKLHRNLTLQFVPTQIKNKIKSLRPWGIESKIWFLKTLKYLRDLHIVPVFNTPDIRLLLTLTSNPFNMLHCLQKFLGKKSKEFIPNSSRPFLCSAFELFSISIVECLEGTTVFTLHRFRWKTCG